MQRIMVQKSYFVLIVVLIALFAFSLPAKAEEKWAVDLFGGCAYNFPSTLTIRQNGYADIVVDSARFDTKPLEDSPYYSIRISKWQDNQAFEFELLHHKLYLENNPPEVQNFELTHGYNILSANKAWRKSDTIYRIGLGVVVSHPEVTIRNTTNQQDEGLFNKGYYFSGLAFQVAVEKQFKLTPNLFLVTEGKLTASYAVIPLGYGEATVSNLALHGLIGMSCRF